MPFTFLAHQVPVLPLKARSPRRWDGLALVIGSIMPDLWYVSSGWLWGPFGIAMWVNGHELGGILGSCVIPGTLLSMALRRWTMPVVPAALPKAAFLRLRDYRLLALSRHRWWVTAYSVLVGALTHIFLDGFTHADGWAVEGIPALREPLVSVGGRTLEVYAALQYGGHVVGSALGAYALLVISRRKLQWEWHGVVGRPPDPIVREPGVAVIRGGLVVGFVVSVGYAVFRLGDGAVPAFMGFCCVGLASLVVVGMIGRRYVEPIEPQLVSPVEAPT